MNAKTINKLLNIESNHSLYRNNGTWYHHLKKFPGVLFDSSGYLIFNDEDEYLTHPELYHKQTLHIRKGISHLPTYIRFTSEQIAILYGVGKTTQNEKYEKTIHTIREISIIKRNPIYVEDIKLLYKNTCQICGIRIAIKGKKFYSEVHHIKPLGSKHNGPDSLDNMICVCPNHHAMLDLESLSLDISVMKSKHSLNNEFIEYHNSLYKNNK